MKIKILAPDGVVFGGKILPKETVLEIAAGPHTNAWLRFKQAEEVKEGKAKPAPTPPVTPPAAPVAEPATSASVAPAVPPAAPKPPAAGKPAAGKSSAAAKK